jgi:signal peptidase I
MTIDRPPPSSAALTSNPYAPSEAIAQEERRAPSRVLAVIASLLGYPLLGCGHLLLGRRRWFIAWLAAGIAVFALMVAGVRGPSPNLYLVSVVALVLLSLACVVHTALSRPGAAALRVSRAWIAAVLLFGAARGTGIATRRWLIEAFKIPSSASAPALLVGDHIMVKKGQGGVGRGDVVVFEYPHDRSTDYVKRVVAVGGDVIEGRGDAVSINGVPLPHTPEEGRCPPSGETGHFADLMDQRCRLVRETNGQRSYVVMFTMSVSESWGPFTVPASSFFVMGDNRDNSHDSRRWGTVPLDHVKGKVSFVWWSQGDTDGIRWSRIGQLVE